MRRGAGGSHVSTTVPAASAGGKVDGFDPYPNRLATRDWDRQVALSDDGQADEVVDDHRDVDDAGEDEQ